MGWFESQIKERKLAEEELLEEAFQKMGRAVTGHSFSESGWSRKGTDAAGAVSELLKHFNVKEKDMPASIVELEDQLDFQLSNTGIMYREVILSEGWHRDAMGALMARLSGSGKVVVILPLHSGGLGYTDPDTGEKVRVTGKTEKRIGKEAFCFYTPFPAEKLGLKDLFRFMASRITSWDIITFIMSALVITGIGLITAKLNKILFGAVIEYESYRLLAGVMSFMLCASLGTMVFTIVRALLTERIRTRLTVSVDAATMMRVLSLPASFFKNYSAGKLNEYIRYMSSLCTLLVDALLTTGITGVFSFIYIFQIAAFADSLVIPAMTVTVFSLAVSVAAAVLQTSVGKKQTAALAEENGLTYSLINGIQKIRISGAENRAFAKWSDLYAKEAALTFNPPLFLKVNTVISSGISLIGTIIIYYVAVETNVSVSDYYAFNSAYGFVTAAFAALATVAVSAGNIRPVLDIVRPLLDAEPESMEGRETVSRLSGGIEFSHVSFRYSEGEPLIVDDLCLEIKPRQYVAIVGRTGCGKSTLVRLLMGFETPMMGTVFFDGKDIRRLDMHSVRKNIGTVMQDSKVFSGSIFENITISDPTLTLDDAWEAADVAGLTELIEEMPMGMNTVLQEGTSAVSGGQKQRIMIARAVAPKPKILILDEATSALDNITQKQVSDSLDAMDCTRIVIAHRLSTIRHCDRILVFDGGRIVEDGTYDELIAQDGFFAELVDRQRLDK